MEEKGRSQEVDRREQLVFSESLRLQVHVFSKSCTYTADAFHVRPIFKDVLTTPSCYVRASQRACSKALDPRCFLHLHMPGWVSAPGECFAAFKVTPVALRKRRLTLASSNIHRSIGAMQAGLCWLTRTHTGQSRAGVLSW